MLVDNFLVMVRHSNLLVDQALRIFKFVCVHYKHVRYLDDNSPPSIVVMVSHAIEFSEASV